MFRPWITKCHGSCLGHGLQSVMGYEVSWVTKCHGLQSVMGYKVSWVTKCHAAIRDVVDTGG